MANQQTQHDDVGAPMLPAFARRRSMSPTQALFLSRLSRLLELEEDWRGRSPTDDWRFRLIYKAIYSTYRDCAEAGVAAEARNLIDRARAANHV